MSYGNSIHHLRNISASRTWISCCIAILPLKSSHFSSKTRFFIVFRSKLRFKKSYGNYKHHFGNISVSRTWIPSCFVILPHKNQHISSKTRFFQIFSKENVKIRIKMIMTHLLVLQIGISLNIRVQDKKLHHNVLLKIP